MRSFILFFFLSELFFAQVKSDISILYDIGDRTCSKNINEIVCKAYTFYKLKSHDSCYVFSEKALTYNTLNSETKDFLNYISGYSAINKGLYKKALVNFNSIPDTSKIKNLKNFQLGRVFLSLEKFDQSIKNYTIWEANNTNFETSLKRVGYHNLALSYIHLKSYIKAKEYFDKEIALIGANDTISAIRAKMDLANVYYNQYLDDKAIPLFKEAYDLSVLYSDIELKHNASKNMAIVEKNRKNFEASVKYFNEYVKWKDSIWNRDRIWELTEKDKQIVVAQKQKEIALQDEKLKRQKVVQKGLLTGGTILIAFLSILSILYKKLHKQNGLITDQKDQLEGLNSTKNYLLSVISHDLRTPVKTIRNNHKQLSKLLEANHTQEALALNQKNTSVSETTSQVLDNILNWALQQNNQLLFVPEFHAIEILISAVLYDFQPIAISKGITLNTMVTDYDLQVYVDKELFKIAFRNLIDNAIKYTPQGEKVTVEVAKQNEKCRVEVRDSGNGMPLEILETINNYKTLTIEKIERSQGLGLGLLLSKTLIIKNSGTFKVANNAESGVSVTLELPLIQA